MPQLNKMALYNGIPLSLRKPYHAKVINTLENINKSKVLNMGQKYNKSINENGCINLTLRQNYSL